MRRSKRECGDGGGNMPKDNPLILRYASALYAATLRNETKMQPLILRYGTIKRAGCLGIAMEVHIFAAWHNR